MSISSKFPQNQSVRSAFTLIEVLVATAVLALIVVLVAQLMNNATNVTAASGKQAEADNTARTVFNIMESDFAGMPIRADLDYFFYKNVTLPGNDSMWFYSNAPGYFSGSVNVANNKSPISFIGYRIPTVNNRPSGGGTTSSPKGEHPSYALERVGAPCENTSDYAVHFLTWPPTPVGATSSPTPYANSTIPGGSRTNSAMKPAPYTDGAYTSSEPTHVVSGAVFRLEFCFVKKDGTYSIPVDTAGKPAPDLSRGIGTGAIKGVVVAIAVLDEKSRVIVTPDLSKAAAALPDIIATDLTKSPPVLMAQKWSATLTDLKTFANKAGIPMAAASQIRVYQRTFTFGGG